MLKEARNQKCIKHITPNKQMNPAQTTILSVMLLKLYTFCPVLAIYWGDHIYSHCWRRYQIWQKFDWM